MLWGLMLSYANFYDFICANYFVPSQRGLSSNCFNEIAVSPLPLGMGWLTVCACMLYQGCGIQKRLREGTDFPLSHLPSFTNGYYFRRSP